MSTKSVACTVFLIICFSSYTLSVPYGYEEKTPTGYDEKPVYESSSTIYDDKSTEKPCGLVCKLDKTKMKVVNATKSAINSTKEAIKNAGKKVKEAYLKKVEEHKARHGGGGKSVVPAKEPEIEYGEESTYEYQTEFYEEKLTDPVVGWDDSKTDQFSTFEQPAAGHGDRHNSGSSTGGSYGAGGGTSFNQGSSTGYNSGSSAGGGYGAGGGASFNQGSSTGYNSGSSAGGGYGAGSLNLGTAIGNGPQQSQPLFPNNQGSSSGHVDGIQGSSGLPLSGNNNNDGFGSASQSGDSIFDGFGSSSVIPPDFLPTTSSFDDVQTFQRSEIVASSRSGASQSSDLEKAKKAIDDLVKNEKKKPSSGY